jgi:hypothetical protein
MRELRRLLDLQMTINLSAPLNQALTASRFVDAPTLAEKLTVYPS